MAEDLRQLRSKTPRTRAAAIDRLWSRLCHQGSVYPASARAVPFLVELSLSTTTKDRHAILELVHGIAVGDQTNFLDGALAATRKKAARKRPRTHTVRTVEEDCYAAVAKRAADLRMLVSDQDARVRGAAAFVLGWLPDPRGVSSKAILLRFTTERDEAARASMLIALGHLGATRARALLERQVADGKATARAAAAIALVYLDPKKVSADVRAVLESACTARSLRRTAQPWNGGDLAGHAAAVLATLPIRSAKRSDAIARLGRVGYLAGDELAGQLVRKVFAGRERKTLSKLTDPQRVLLETIVRAGLLRPQGFVEHALGMRGLPALRDLPRFVGIDAGVHPEIRRRRRSPQAGTST